MKLFVNSLPKSGTNLVQKLVELLNFKYSGKSLASTNLIGRYQFIKTLLHGSWFDVNPLIIGLEIPTATSSKWVNKQLSSLHDHTYISGHAAYSDHLAFLLAKNNIKVLQVSRNPYDVIYSWVNYIVEDNNHWHPLHTHLKSMSFDERVKFTVTGGFVEGKKLYIESFRSILRSQEGWFESEIVLPLKFEDMVGSQGGGDDNIQAETIEKICDFLEINVSNTAFISQHLYGGTHTFRSGQIRGGSQFSEELRAFITKNIGKQR